MQVIDCGVLDHGADGAPGYCRQTAPDLLGFRSQLSIAYYIECPAIALAIRASGGPGGSTQVHRALVEKHLCNGAAIGVHFIIALAIDLDIDENRWKCGRDGRGCQHNLLEKFECIRMIAVGNGAHVPDDQCLGIHVGGAHVEATSLVVGPGHGLDKVGIEVRLDESFERCSAGECLALEDDPEDVQSLQDVACLGSSEDGLQLRVIPGPQKGERCSERAGADPGNHLEIRACTRCGPAVQDPRPESATGAAAGQGKSVIDRVAAVIQREGPGRFLFYRGDYVGLEIRVELAGPGTHTGHAGDFGTVDIVYGDGVARQAGTAAQQGEEQACKQGLQPVNLHVALGCHQFPGCGVHCGKGITGLPEAG